MAAMAGSGAIVRQGHLRKLKTMRKKYFVLRAESGEVSARLEYYESEKKFRAGAAPRRVLPLTSCYNIMRRLDLKQKHVIALFTREEQLCIVAENEQDLHAWLAAILKQHHSGDASQELLHPIQHVWQVNVQKKGLGASKNIHGLYNLCLTDKTLTLVKIKSHNNIISDLGIPEKVEYSLKNIRRCGDSECFFYMEVGRQTVTGAGELWMHSDDSNIAQSMHSTIYLAMENCAKETENEKDHIVVPAKGGRAQPALRHTYSDGSAHAASIAADKGLFMCSCIRQCVCASAAYAVDAAPAPPAPPAPNAENPPANNPLTSDRGEGRGFRHHRTESLPAAPLPEPRVVHTRTFSAPLTGDELDRAVVEKALLAHATHASCKAVNGTDAYAKKAQWAGRRASAGARLSKLAMSPAHTKNAGTLRSRCDSMPSRACSLSESERPPPRHTELLEGLDSSRDDIDSVEWYGTPRIPEEPDSCDILSKEIMNMTTRGSSVAHSRTSSFGADDGEGPELAGAGGAGAAPGYLPMAPLHDPLATLVSSSGSVYSGTPSTDPRFSEYQLEPAVSHIAEERATRAYSVGSRPGPRAEPPPRTRAYSAGARHRPAPAAHAHAQHHHHHHADDHMELDFSANSSSPKVTVARTPPASSFVEARARTNVDEYVDMSPRAAGYVDMRPGEPPTPTPAPAPAASTPDGYVQMSYGRPATRPIAIATPRAPPPPAAHSPDDSRRRRTPRTPAGSQTIFPISLDSPASPELDAAELEEDPPHHALSTVREISEDGREGRDAREGRRSPLPEVSSSPQYVTLRPGAAKPPEPEELCCNPTAAKTMVRPPEDTDRGETATVPGALHYAALDLEPRRAAAAPAPRLYTQIDFLRSEQMHADAT